MNPADFENFLNLLSSTSGGEDGGSCYIGLHRKLERFFSLKGISDPGEAADATISVAVRRIAGGAPVPDAGKYCMGIARNIFRERLRTERRESEVFVKFLTALRDDDSGEVAAWIERVLRPCFESLAPKEQEFLVAYCRILHGRARAQHRRELAEEMNTTVTGLRMRVTRLREILTKCVEKGSQ